MKPGQISIDKSGGGALERIARLMALEATSIEVGIQGEAVPVPLETRAKPEQLQDLPSIAARLEYGDPETNLPARPWMSTTADKHGKEWAKELNKVVKLTARGEHEKADMGLRIIGAIAVGNMQDNLRDGGWAKNAESTRIAKWENLSRPGPLEAFISQPLIESGQLVQSHRAVLVRDGDMEVVPYKRREVIA